MSEPCKLSDIVEFNPKISFKKNKDYPFIEMADVDGISKYIKSKATKPFGTGGGAKFEENDILFARIEPCLDNKKICKVKQKGFGSTEFFVLRAKKHVCDQDFLFYLTKTQYIIQSALNSYSGASGRQRADLKFLKGLEIKVPKIETQQKIASILSAYDDLIENNNQRIQLLEEMAEEIYKEWFVRMRYPGYENTKFVNKKGEEVKHGEEGARPEGWKEDRVQNFGKVVTGKTPSKTDDSNFYGEIPFIKTPDMQQGMFFINTEEKLSIKGADSQMNQYVPENSISVSCIGTVGKVGITTRKSQTNQQINTLIPHNNYNTEFLYFALLLLKPVIESYAATGATMANLSKSKFEKLKLLQPSENLIIKFHHIVKSMFDEIKILMEKNQVLQETRDLLLPRLISGKLDVSDLEIESEAIMNQAAEPAEGYA